MTQVEQFYASNSMVSEPPRPCNFKVGDVVMYTNDYGITFGPFNVIGFTKPENVLNGRCVHINTDAPWYPVHVEQLTLVQQA